MKKILHSLFNTFNYIRTSFFKHSYNEIRSQYIKDELQKREEALYQCALAVEKDTKLRKEMQEWDITLNDGDIDSKPSAKPSSVDTSCPNKL